MTVKSSFKFNVAMRGLERQVDQAKKRALVEYGRAELVDIQRRIVTAKTDPYAQRWAPWSFATMRARMRDGTFGRGLLHKTGRLLRSFMANIRGDELEISSSAPYAQYLQEGRQNMRPRVIVDLASKLSFNRFAKILKKNLGRIK